ncbi:hypothetical protein JXJ21_20720 [candidate division KSB1 bacterium]|nr:hypothetical protein [candidate division KSB1 bacterium]
MPFEDVFQLTRVTNDTCGVGMNKRTLIFCMILFFVQPVIPAQGKYPDEFDTGSCEIGKIRIPLRSAGRDTSGKFALIDEVAIILQDALSQQGYWGIQVGIRVGEELAQPNDSLETSFDSRIVEFDDLFGYMDLLLIDSLEFSQNKTISQTTSPADESYFNQSGSCIFGFPGLFNMFRRRDGGKDGAEGGAIRTDVSVQIAQIEVDSCRVLDIFAVSATGWGATAFKSKIEALDNLAHNARFEFDWRYGLSSGVFAVENQEVSLQSGSRAGIRENILFEMITPALIEDSVLTDESYGEDSAALLKIVKTTRDSSTGRLLRQWRPLLPGCWATEYPSSVHALQLVVALPAPPGYNAFGAQFMARPLEKADWGLGFKAVRIDDSYNERVWGFGMGGFGIWRFFETQKFDLGGKIGLDFDFLFKQDEEENIVSTGLFSAPLTLTAEILISKHVDFFIETGYRFGMKSSKWSYSEDEESYPAFWLNDPPEVTSSGLVLTVGYKYNGF